MKRDHDRHLHVLSSSPPSEPDPEFAPGVDEPPSELDRREMMKLLAAGASLAGVGSLAACMEPPNERIMPRVEQPPELVPGVPLAYATSMVIDGYATGLLVQTHEARPTKIEGNPDHPASLGATNAYHQASILELYDPDRARGASHAGMPVSLANLMRGIARRERIPNLWFLLHPQSSPIVLDLMTRIRARHPGARFATHAPLDRRHVYEGARLAFGRPLEAQYRFDLADVVVALDADFTAAMPHSVRWARDFATRRRLRSPSGEMSRLYMAEPRPSPTGSLADHRLPARASEIQAIAVALRAAVQGRPGPALSPRQQFWVRAAALDLRAARGRGLVVAGDRQPPQVHALVHAINDAIGAPGATVTFTQPALIEPLGEDLAALASAIDRGEVTTLVIAEANPVYTAPLELDFATLLERVPETWCAAFDENETSRKCRTFLPLAHYLESWGDARAYGGTISLIQPMIRPMYGSSSLVELLAAFAGDAFPDGHRLLRERYLEVTSDPAAAPAALTAWRRLLQLGLVPDSAFAPEPAALQMSGAALDAMTAESPPPGDDAFEVSFDQSHAVYDGRFAGNSWLQELPKPHEKLTWGNAAVISPATARALGVGNGDIVSITNGARDVELPVYVIAGHADGCASLELGYGRWVGGPVAEGVGSRAYAIRRLAVPGFATTASVRPTGEHRTLAITQQHFDQHGRGIALHAELAFYRANPDFTEDHRGPQPSLLPDLLEKAPQWGMSIDTMICTGCSACVIACQAENNVPVVGAKGVIENREMHWLRIDTYREERGDEVDFIHQPMLCQHCDKAPCEYVCPVYATQHSPDGLNEMIYNRCIGTRFCSNNCPYKVRRFNWFDYTEDTPKTLSLQRNPNVTVRARGVMEKCTYCVQRIRAAEIAARKDRREIAPGEVVTACQQACPTGAIQFGLLNHTDTAVVEWRRQPRHYGVLHHLGARPKTIYLAKISNPRRGG